VVHSCGIEIRDFRGRQLEHHLAAIRQGVELPGQFREKDGFGAGLVRALNRDFRLDDGHEAVLGDLRDHLELLRHHGSDSLSRGQVDEGAHLGAKDAELHRPGK
jgi:hypothetical protein